MISLQLNATDIRVEQGEGKALPALVGIAAPYEKYATLEMRVAMANRLREKIARGAFKRILFKVENGERNVKGLVDHNPQKLLGDTTTRSLQLSESDLGLQFRLQLPDTSVGRDILHLAGASLLAGVSIGFTPPQHADQVRVAPPDGNPDTVIPMQIPDHESGSSWVVGGNKTSGRFRIIKDVSLTEVSVITGGNPAYHNTSVALEERNSDRERLKLLARSYEY